MAEELLTAKLPNPSEKVALVEATFDDPRDDSFQFDASPPKPEPAEPTAAAPVEPEPEPVTPEPDPKPKPVAPAAVAPKHSDEMIQFATERYGLSGEEVAAMTPDQLAGTMAMMERQTQRVLHANRPVPETQAPAAPAPKTYDFKANPNGYDEETLNTLQAGLAAVEQNRILTQRLDALEPMVRQAQVQPVQQRIAGLAAEMGPEAAAKYAIGTPAFTKLFNRMGSIQREALDAGERLTEKEIFEQSARSLGLVKIDTKKAETEAALEVRKKEYDENALAKPSSRQTDPDAHTRVRDVLSKNRLPVADKTERQVEWHD